MLLPKLRNRSKMCSYHRDHTHTTKECTSLTRHIKVLIMNGYLDSYVVFIGEGLV